MLRGMLYQTVHVQALAFHHPTTLLVGVPAALRSASNAGKCGTCLNLGGFMQAVLRTFWSDESGQGLVEYALIIALIAVGLIAILLVLRNSIGNVFNNAAAQLNNAPATAYP